jgi:hypothetical protein
MPRTTKRGMSAVVHDASAIGGLVQGIRTGEVTDTTVVVVEPGFGGSAMRAHVHRPGRRGEEVIEGLEDVKAGTPAGRGWLEGVMADVCTDRMVVSEPAMRAAIGAAWPDLARAEAIATSLEPAAQKYNVAVEVVHPARQSVEPEPPTGPEAGAPVAAGLRRGKVTKLNEQQVNTLPSLLRALSAAGGGTGWLGKPVVDTGATVVGSEGRLSGALRATQYRLGGKLLEQRFLPSREAITAQQWVGALVDEHHGSAVVVLDEDTLMAGSANPPLRLDPEALAKQHNVAVAVIPVQTTGRGRPS